MPENITDLDRSTAGNLVFTTLEFHSDFFGTGEEKPLKRGRHVRVGREPLKRGRHALDIKAIVTIKHPSVVREVSSSCTQPQTA